MNYRIVAYIVPAGETAEQYEKRLPELEDSFWASGVYSEKQLATDEDWEEMGKSLGLCLKDGAK